jgi:hypothetical protein
MTKAIDPVIREQNKEIKKLIEELELLGHLELGKIPPWTNRATHQWAEIGRWDKVLECLRVRLAVKTVTSRAGLVAVLGLDMDDLGDPKDRERRKQMPGKPDSARK